MKILLPFLFFLLSLSLFAQTTNFSTKHEEFIVQLKERFESTIGKSESKEFLDEFYVLWSSPSLTSADKDRIIGTLNLLVAKKAVPIPDFQNYLRTYRVFVINEHIGESFSNWHQALDDMIKKSRVAMRNINEFLISSQDQVSRSIISSNASVKWVSSNREFRYLYDGKLTLLFGPTVLTCFSANDSITIYDTEGVFVNDANIWNGKKGRITWERAGFDANVVNATFGAYKISMDKSYCTIDSVSFNNKQFFATPLAGKIDYKVVSFSSTEAATFPKFTSYEQRFKINNIHPNMFYEGGFSQVGAKFLGSGTNENPATITLYRKDTLFVTARSLYFSLRKDEITSSETEIKLHVDSGFIYHPSLVFKFMVDRNELFLIRSDDGIAKSPYFNTYHNISMDVELIRWNLDNSLVDFTMLSGAATNYAFFESLSYYREEFYVQLQGLDAIHPLQGLKDCSKYYHGQPFTAKDYSKFLRMSESQVRQQVMKLSFSGFVGYNSNTDTIEIRDKLYDYLNFRLGKKDYDVIRFNSTTSSLVANAQLDLKNYDLRLNGVSNISICDHQNVVFFPKSETIVLKQNRNFLFDGTINAGMLNLFGDGFKFSYENFRIDIKTIDSMRMQVQTGDLDYFGKPKLTTVNNTISQLSGYLQIDDKNNKSGSKTNPNFPILTSTKESYVYFDKPEIQHGKYVKDKFFFVLDTFKLDSINSLAKQNVNFAGKFSSNIFPDFRENLTVRPDFSLGFNRKTPSTGFPIYGGSAHFTNNIDLSNKGLYGDGVLKYLGSTGLSESFLFLPDQVLGVVHQFTLEKQSKGVIFPDVSGRFAKIDFRPYSNKMDLTSQEENFVMYNGEAQLNGSILLEPTGLTGKGAFYMKNGSLSSKYYTFADKSLVADSSDFTLATKDIEGVSFSTKNLMSTIDFEKRTGNFISKSGGSQVEFTENRYVSFVREFSWDMDKNLIYLGQKGSVGNRFVSVHKKQDSLDFLVPLARYDVFSKLIECQEVKEIKVADATVLLKDGIVRIRENAVLDVMDSTVIEINNKMHRLYDARVNIEGKYAYSGFGKYDFINGDNKRLTIGMYKFGLNELLETEAEGTIVSDEYFTFDKHFAYKGKVALNAKDSLLTFDGGVQMLHRCIEGPQSYIRFMSRIDPKNVEIPIDDEVLDIERKNLYANFFLKKDSTHLYSSFFEGRKFYSDIPVLTGKGMLKYSNNSFVVASSQKHLNPDTVGTVLRYSEADCNVYGEGILDFGIDLEQVKYKTSGTVLDQRNKNVFNISALFGVDFFLDQRLIDMMVADIRISTAKKSELSSETFIRRMAELTGTSDAKKIDLDRSSIEIVKTIPVEYQNLLNFGNIDWTWNTTTASYIAKGDADLLFVDANAVNRKVKVVAEILRKRSGNSIDLYVELDEKTWLYFGYKASLMQILSSNSAFNSQVQLLKPEERKMKTGMGEKPFSFIMAPDSKKTRFLKRIDTILAGNAVEEEPEEENIAPEAGVTTPPAE